MTVPIRRLPARTELPKTEEYKMHKPELKKLIGFHSGMLTSITVRYAQAACWQSSLLPTAGSFPPCAYLVPLVAIPFPSDLIV